MLRNVARGEYANTAGKPRSNSISTRGHRTKCGHPARSRRSTGPSGRLRFADRPLARVRPTQIQSWAKVMADKPLAPNMIRSRFDHVRAVIRAAVADRAIP